MEKLFTVYILTNTKNGVLYVGVTSNLLQRIWQHKEGVVKGFSKKYGLKMLVYYEIYNDAETAIRREKRMKRYRRQAKIELVEKKNPKWEDLYERLL